MHDHKLGPLLKKICSLFIANFLVFNHGITSASSLPSSPPNINHIAKKIIATPALPSLVINPNSPCIAQQEYNGIWMQHNEYTLRNAILLLNDDDQKELFAVCEADDINNFITKLLTSSADDHDCLDQLSAASTDPTDSQNPTWAVSNPHLVQLAQQFQTDIHSFSASSQNCAYELQKQEAKKQAENTKKSS